MEMEQLRIDNIPAILWGAKAESVYIYVHGKNASKEEAFGFAEKAVTHTNSLTLSGRTPAIAMILSRMG